MEGQATSPLIKVGSGVSRFLTPLFKNEKKKAHTDYKVVKNYILSKAVVSGRKEDTVRNDSSRLRSRYT